MTDYNKTFKVKANDYDFVVTREEAEAADVSEGMQGKYHLISNNKSVNAQLLSHGNHFRKQELELSDELFHVEIKNELDLVLDQMGFGKATGKQIKEVKAPMPGLVLEINVTEGQEVNEGDKLLILVAMKMENSIAIHTKAVIKKINVKVGQAVEKGYVLVELA